MSAAVERTVKYATTVDTLAEAWAFVMDHLDQLGPRPSIEITPSWRSVPDSGAWTDHFEVAVSGMTP